MGDGGWGLVASDGHLLLLVCDSKLVCDDLQPLSSCLVHPLPIEVLGVYREGGVGEGKEGECVRSGE